MATIYVATTGKDSAAGTAATPFRTIGAAMAKAVAGDVVLVADGTYSEDLKPNMIEVKGGVTLRAQNRLGAKLRPPSYVYAIVNLNSGTAANPTTCDGFDLGSARIHNHGVFTNGGRYVRALTSAEGPPLLHQSADSAAASLTPRSYAARSIAVRAAWASAGVRARMLPRSQPANSSSARATLACPVRVFSR